MARKKREKINIKVDGEFEALLSILSSCGHGSMTSVLKIGLFYILSPRQLSKNEVSNRVSQFIPKEIMNKLLDQDVDYFELAKELALVEQDDTECIPLEKETKDKPKRDDYKIEVTTEGKDEQIQKKHKRPRESDVVIIKGGDEDMIDMSGGMFGS